jgi:hypothetical protein
MWMKTGILHAQIDLGMQLESPPGALERRPWEERQGQIDGAGVERVGRAVELRQQRVIGIKLAGLRDQRCREVSVDAPVPHLVGLGQRRAPHLATDAHVVELAGLRIEARDRVAQAIAIGELGERHAAELVLAAEALDKAVAAVAVDRAPQRVERQMLHELREHQLALVHDASLPDKEGWTPAEILGSNQVGNSGKMPKTTYAAMLYLIAA